MSGKIASNINVKLYVFLMWFIINISGLTNSFELASGVAQDMINMLHWIAAGPSKKNHERDSEGPRLYDIIKFVKFGPGGR